MAILPPGYELVPRRAAPGEDAPRYRIIDVAGRPGGFGITYIAEKLPVERPSASDFSRRLWLQPGVRVAIKEYFPNRMAARAADGVRVIPAGDGEDGAFPVYLKRFRKEAERLFLLTLLFIVRTADVAPGSAAHAMASRFLRELEGGVKRGSEQHLIAGAMQVIDQFDAAQRGQARRQLAERALPTVYDYFAGNGTAYYVMEFLEGGSLYQRLSPGRAPLDHAQEFVPLARRLLDALAEIHDGLPGRPLIHCDIKPGNIMFRDRSVVRPVLIDFGLTRSVAVEGTSLFYGHTAAYASPEQAAEARGEPVGRGDTVGPWVDIYAAGKVLFEAARGRIGGGPEAGLPAGYPAAVSRALNAAVLPDWRRRPASVAAWRAMLFGAGEAAAPQPWPARPVLVPLVAVVALVLGGTAVWAMQQMTAAPSAPTPTPTPTFVPSPPPHGSDSPPPTPPPSPAPTPQDSTPPPEPSPTPSATPTRGAAPSPAAVPPPPPDLAAIDDAIGVSLRPDARGRYEIYGRQPGTGDWANGAKTFIRACDRGAVATALARAREAGGLCLIGVDADGHNPARYTWSPGGAEGQTVTIRHSRLAVPTPRQGL